jgi:O-antigen ligase
MTANARADAAPEVLRPAAPARQRARATSWPLFWALMLFFLLEYARPPALAQLRLQMIFILVFPALWLVVSDRPWSRSLTLHALFLGVCASGLLFATNTFAAYIVARGIFGHLVVALAITTTLATWRTFTLGLWIWVAIMAYQAIYALTHGGRGSGGFFADENDLALGCACAFAITFVAVRELTGWKRLAAIGLTALYASAVVASFSRGGFLALAAAALYCVWTGRNRARNLALGALGAGVFFLLIPADYKAELQTMSDTDEGTAHVRQFMWTAAVRMWNANPVLGVGAGNSNWRLGEYQPREGRFSAPEYTERDWSTQSVHSTFFQLLAELGVVGVVLFGLLITGHFRTMRMLRKEAAEDPALSAQRRREIELYAVGLGGAMVAYLAGGLFLSVLYYPYPWYFCAMSVACARAVEGLGSTAVPELATAPESAPA